MLGVGSMLEANDKKTKGKLVVEEEYSGINKLDIIGHFFDIEVTGRGQENITLNIYASTEKGYKIDYKKNGNLLKIKVNVGFSLFTNPFAYYKMVLSVPLKTSIRIDNSAGNVQIENIKTKNCFVETSSGSIDLTGIDSRLDVKSTSGNSEIKQCQGDKKISSSSGKISVIESPGKIISSSSSGSQYFQNIDSNIAAEATSGTIRIKSFSGQLDLETSSGSQIGENVSLTDNSVFRSSSGNINIKFSDEMDNYSFDLKSSSGRLIAGSIKAERKLVSEKGKIMIKGNSSSGSQTYKSMVN